jgi:hypothetical protein
VQFLKSVWDDSEKAKSENSNECRKSWYQLENWSQRIIAVLKRAVNEQLENRLDKKSIKFKKTLYFFRE